MNTVSGEAPAQFEIEEDTRSDFTEPRTIYRGAENATTLSGKANGTYYYRVRILSESPGDDAHSGWSATQAVQVEHHPLGRAFAFLLLGAFVFVGTAVLILRGASRDDDRAGDGATGGVD